MDRAPPETGQGGNLAGVGIGQVDLTGGTAAAAGLIVFNELPALLDFCELVLEFGAGVLKAMAGAGALEIAPEVELEEDAGMAGTAAFGEAAAGFESEGGRSGMSTKASMARTGLEGGM